MTEDYTELAMTLDLALYELAKLKGLGEKPCEHWCSCYPKRTNAPGQHCNECDGTMVLEPLNDTDQD